MGQASEVYHGPKGPLGPRAHGPKFGSPNFGPKLGAQIWSPNLGHKFGTQIWGTKETCGKTWPGFGVAWPGFGHGLAWVLAWLGLGFGAQNFEIVHGPHGCPARPHHTQPGQAKPRPGHAIPKSGHAKPRPGHGKLRPSHAKARPGHAKTQAKPRQTQARFCLRIRLRFCPLVLPQVLLQVLLQVFP